MKRLLICLTLIAGLLVGISPSAQADTLTFPCGPNGETYSVIMPAGAATSGYSCSGVLVLDSSVKIIDSTAFGGSELTAVTIPNSVQSIGDWAFEGTQIGSLIIPGSVVTIGEWAFANSKLLKSVVIPNSVKNIGARAFLGTSLVSISLPSSIVSIGRDAFAGTSFTSISIPISWTRIPDAFGGTKIDSLIIPNTVTHIDHSAFSGVPLKTLTIAGSVVSIGMKAFAGTQLTSVVIPNSVTKIDDRAFADNLALTTVSLPDELRILGSNVFERNYSLTSIIYCGKLTGLPIIPTCPPERKSVIDAAELKAKQEVEAKAATEIVDRARVAKAIADLNVKFKSLQKSYTAPQLVKIRAGLDWANITWSAGLQGFQYRGFEQSVISLAVEWDDFIVKNPLKTTITCVKGKLTKKVTAVKPKCPTGYKKK